MDKSDHAYYFAKTGNSGPASTAWDYGPGHRNDQSQIVWWHYCPSEEYRIEGKPLVVMRTWTLNPVRMSSMFNLFDDVPPGAVSRYQNFGLHIHRPTKGWSCLSNVGLALVDSSFPGFAGPPTTWKWHFEKDLPSTVNKSVWKLLCGFEGEGNVIDEAGQPIKDTALLALTNEVVDIVLGESEGMSWGGYKNIHNEQDPNSMVSKLFNVLQGKTIRGTRIDNKSDLGLNSSSTDHLEYFDPGLVPADFTDNPKDIVYPTPP